MIVHNIKKKIKKIIIIPNPYIEVKCIADVVAERKLTTKDHKELL